MQVMASNKHYYNVRADCPSVAQAFIHTNLIRQENVLIRHKFLDYFEYLLLFIRGYTHGNIYNV